MKKRILSLCVVVLISIVHAFGGVTLTVPDVKIVPGGTSHVVINFDLGANTYTAYQFDIAYPAGISSENDNSGSPAFVKGEIYDSEHTVSSIYTTTGLSRFQCFSVNTKPFTAQSGTLLVLSIKAEKSLAQGTYQATIAPIEFVETNANPDRPEALTFNIVVSNQVELDETSTVAPVTATGVNVKVKRTINANEWSTICLPFAMTEAQVKTAFGNDVQLGDFNGYETVETGKEVTSISVKFETATAIDANHPYIIKVSAPITEFSANNVNISLEEPIVAAVVRNKKQWSEMIGTYVANTVLGEDDPVLFLSDNKFYYAVGKTKMKAFRAYFDFYDVLSEVENAASRIMIAFDDQITGISSVENGKENMESYYSMSGQRVTIPAKGLYIQKGKKKIFK